MTLIQTIFLLFFCFFTSAAANAANNDTLKVDVDCYLSSHILECHDLVDAFYAEAKGVVRSQSTDAQILLKVRSWSLPSGQVQFDLEFTDKSGTVSTFKLSGDALKLKGNESETVAIAKILKHMLKGIVVFFEIEEYKIDPKGAWVFTYKPKITKKTASKTPYFAEGGVGANVQINGSTAISGWSYANVGYISPKWLWTVGGGSEYSYISVETSEGTEKASNLRGGGSIFGARSVSKHWSVAALLRAGHNPSSNYDARVQGHVGIEYELIPYLEDNDNAFTISYVIGESYENYVTENIRDELSAYLTTHAVSVYFVKHLQWFDVAVAGVGTSLVNDISKYAVGGSATLRLYLSKNISIDLQNQVGYRKNLMNAPKDPDALNPLLSVVGSGSSVEPISYSLNVNLNYQWGNQMGRKKNMRWRFSPTSVPVNF